MRILGLFSKGWYVELGSSRNAPLGAILGLGGELLEEVLDARELRDE